MYLEETDAEILGRSADLLEATGRRSPCTLVALHCLNAAQMLSALGVDRYVEPEPSQNDDEVLGRVLGLLEDVSDTALRDDKVVGAMHHALLARVASR